MVPALQSNNDAKIFFLVGLSVLLDIKLSLCGRLDVGVSEREEPRICSSIFA